MTRMWCINPESLCTNHLNGYHNEMHQAVGTINKHQHGRAIIEGRVFDDKPDQIDTSRIQKEHDKLANELIRRGMNHNSPMSFDDPWDMGEIDTKYNIKDLIDRCSECKNKLLNKIPKGVLK